MTAQRVTPVLRALDELWQVLPVLQNWLDDVTARLRRLPWFNATSELFEIQQLIEGESIAIVTRTSYAQRGLLTPEEVTQRLRPQRVLDAMVLAYDQAKAIVIEVGDAVARLDGQFDRASRELAELSALADELGEPPPELGPLAARLAEAKAKAARDPLAAALAGDIAPELERVHRRLTDEKLAHGRLEAELGAAGAQLDALEAALTAAQRAHDERSVKIALVAPPPPPFGREVLDQLAGWRDRLVQAFRAGKRSAVRLGFANWNAQLDARLDECSRITSENQRSLDRRRELRGLLDGFKAKAAATGLAEDAMTTALYRRAHTLLHERPTPLAAAEQVVAEYVAAVRQ
jgi:hypothetical protein